MFQIIRKCESDQRTIRLASSLGAENAKRAAGSPGDESDPVNQSPGKREFIRLEFRFKKRFVKTIHNALYFY